MKKINYKIYTILIILGLFFGFNTLKAQTIDEYTYSQEVKNLVAFAKSYGYIRFFYPNEQTKNFNWDAFLVYGTKKVRGLKTENELKTTLSNLFLPIAPYVKFSSNNNTELNVSTITQGDSITFWQHKSFSIGENIGAKMSGDDLKILVNTVFDSSKVIEPSSPFLKDSVQFQHVDYRNSGRYQLPESYAYLYDSELNFKYILNIQPDPSLPFSAELGDNLWITIPIVLSNQESKHLTQGTEIEKLSEELMKFYDNITIYQKDDIWYTDFISAWNAIHHLFPYRKSSEKMFGFQSSNHLAYGLNQISISSDKKSASYNVVKKYVSLFQDGHASVFRYQTPDLVNQNSKKPKRLRSWLPFYRILLQDKVYVLRSFDPKIKNGDEILEINKKKVSALINRATNNGVSSSQANLLSAVGSIGYFVNTTKATLKIKRNDQTIKLKVNTIPAPAAEYFEYINNPFEHKSFKYPNTETIYINASLATQEEVANKIPDILEAKHLIIDLRDYPKPNVLRPLFEHLDVNGGIGRSLILSNPINMHPNQEFRHHVWSSSLIIPKGPFIKAKIYVLIGSSIPSSTRSRGETSASYLKYVGATLVGDSNSKGASGGLNWFTTPGKIRIKLTTSYTVRQNGEKMQSIGITPDILVTQKVEGLKEGKDQVYETALKQIQEN